MLFKIVIINIHIINLQLTAKILITKMYLNVHNNLQYTDDLHNHLINVGRTIGIYNIHEYLLNL